MPLDDLVHDTGSLITEGISQEKCKKTLTSTLCLYYNEQATQTTCYWSMEGTKGISTHHTIIWMMYPSKKYNMNGIHSLHECMNVSRRDGCRSKCLSSFLSLGNDWWVYYGHIQPHILHGSEGKSAEWACKRILALAPSHTPEIDLLSDQPHSTISPQYTKGC